MLRCQSSTGSSGVLTYGRSSTNTLHRVEAPLQGLPLHPQLWQCLLENAMHLPHSRTLEKKE